VVKNEHTHVPDGASETKGSVQSQVRKCLAECFSDRKCPFKSINIFHGKTAMMGLQLLHWNIPIFQRKQS